MSSEAATSSWWMTGNGQSDRQNAVDKWYTKSLVGRNNSSGGGEAFHRLIRKGEAQ